VTFERFDLESQTATRQKPRKAWLDSQTLKVVGEDARGFVPSGNLCRPHY
jgi:hypothetical protein